MKNTLLKIAAPLVAAFALAGCATHKQGLHEAAMKTAVVLSAADDFQTVAGCNGDNGRGGMLSYSDSRSEARLDLVDGNKVTVLTVKDDPANPNAAFQQLNDWCYKK
ncbi:MAG TPA: hypothetical protein VL625_04270 [Patescibacteria group bacterium]|jgi:predicted small secreted protein|nr:hypothetical protein [Patescibacteria group bacterium]